MNRLGQASLFAIALIETASAIRTRVWEEDQFDEEDPFTNMAPDTDNLEGSEEQGSSALYYDPEGGYIYEVTADDGST